MFLSYEKSQDGHKMFSIIHDVSVFIMLAYFRARLERQRPDIKLIVFSVSLCVWILEKLKR